MSTEFTVDPASQPEAIRRLANGAKEDAWLAVTAWNRLAQDDEDDEDVADSRDCARDEAATATIACEAACKSADLATEAMVAGRDDLTWRLLANGWQHAALAGKLARDAADGLAV
jgi:hypothetical protein